MDRQAHWQNVYATKRDDEVSWFQTRPDTSLDLLLRARPGAGTPVIDVGGGASRLIDHLLDLGYSDLTVLDIAEAALATARARIGEAAARVAWVAADVTAWSPPRAFGLWHDRAVFHFLVDESDRRAYAATMASAVTAGGQAIIGTFALDGPERCSNLPIRRYDAAGLAAEFAPHFRPVEDLAADHVTPAGKTQKFQFCRLLRV
ncbi:MAG: methyltransferase domain-containing protein [Magnetospirillum sp.]|nr:methyltransferase domain-containing protein [Magnetospirillum sp.]